MEHGWKLHWKRLRQKTWEEAGSRRRKSLKRKKEKWQFQMPSFNPN